MPATTRPSCGGATAPSSGCAKNPVPCSPSSPAPPTNPTPQPSLPATPSSSTLEVVSNIVNYAGATVFEVTAEFSSARAGLTVSDNGKPYVPFAHADPDPSLPSDARPIGGLGILIVKKTAASVTHHRENGHNVLCFEKAVGGKERAIPSANP